MKRQPSSPKPPPGEAAVRQRIVATARQHFFAHGFRGVTMDDLAAELGMSKKTLYTHFASKTALVEAILQAKFHDVETALTQITTACAAEFTAGLQRLLACLQQQTAEIQPAFVRDLQREAPELFQLVETRRRALVRQHFGKLFSAGRQEGLIRKDVPAHLLVEILLGAVQAIMNPPRMAELDLTPTSGFTAITSVILQGALTSEGRSKL